VTDPKYDDADLAAAEAEEAAQSTDQGPDVPDTEADDDVNPTSGGDGSANVDVNEQHPDATYDEPVSTEAGS